MEESKYVLVFGVVHASIIHIQWKVIFAERYRLFSNWMKGRCTVRTFAGHTQGVPIVYIALVTSILPLYAIVYKSFVLIHTSLGILDGCVYCQVISAVLSTYMNAVLCSLLYLGILCIQFDDTRIVSGSSDKTIKVTYYYTNGIRLLLVIIGVEYTY